MFTGKLKCAEKRHERQDNNIIINGCIELISLCKFGWLQHITVICNAWFKLGILLIRNHTQNYIRINSGNKKQMKRNVT